MNVRTLTLFCALAAVLVSAAGCARKPTDLRGSLAATQMQAPEGAPLLLAAYQPWFGGKNHMDVGYHSHDQQVLARQVVEAKNFGIEAFVVNWYGPRKEFEDRAYEALQNQAAKNAFKLAIMYDEDTGYPGQATEAVMVDLQYAYDKYIGPNAIASRSAYLRFNGRPVIFIFPKEADTDWSRIRQMTQSWEDKPLLIMKDINEKYTNAFDGFYAWVQPGKRGWQPDGSNWGEEYLETFYHRMKNEFPGKIAVGAAWPGFNDSKAAWGRNRRMDARCGKTFDETLRLFRRYYSEDHPLPFLMINTWNDYEEGTAIERGLDRCNGPSPRETKTAASAR